MEFSAIKELIEKPSSNFSWAKRIDFRSTDFSYIEEEVLTNGLPIVISNTTVSWKRDRELFSWEWLKKNMGNVTIKTRDSDAQRELTNWTTKELIDYLHLPKEKRTPPRIYGRDIPCPNQWKEFIAQKIPELVSKGEHDLMGETLKELQMESTVINLAGDDTVFPTHIEHMGSMGNNIMVYAEEGTCSLWFCVPSEDREKAATFWKQFGGSVYLDNLPLTVDQLSQAPFTIHVIEQREGDYVIVPPQAVHQVINKGGRFINIAWTTMPHQAIQSAYEEILPLYRSLGKPEHYRIKSVVYYCLLNRIEAARDVRTTDALVEELPPLLSILEDIIHSEWIEGNDIEAMRFTEDGVPHMRSCDFCKCDIWNRCYHCSKCGKSGYDLCLHCVAEGRSCQHREELELTEYFSITTTKETFEQAQETYQKLLKSAKRKKNKKKKLVEWAPRSSTSTPSIATLAYRIIKKYRTEEQNEPCHQCEKVQPPNIAVSVTCSNSACKKVYCTKCLWNRYAIKLVDCMYSEKWKCPACQSRCNCNPCSEKHNMPPAESPDGIPGYADALEASYPFQSLSSPNTPCPSDYKPVFNTYALKKRKFPLLSSSSSSPSKAPTSSSSFEMDKGTKSSLLTDLNNLSSAVNVFRAINALPATDSSSPTSVWSPQKKEEYLSPRPEPPAQQPPPQQSVFSSDESPVVWKDSYGHHEVDHKTTLLVRNLSYNCTCEDLGELFKTCGTIDQITIPLDKATNKLRGYGFIKFVRREDAEAAMARFNGHALKDRAIELEWSLDKTTRRVGDPNRTREHPCFKCGKLGHVLRNCPKFLSETNALPPAPASEDFDEKRDRNPRDNMAHEKDKVKEREGKRGYICFNCGKEGHVALECREGSENGPGFKAVVCFKCGVAGHLANKCDKRVRGCFLCGKDGHIASECSEQASFRDYRERMLQQHNQNYHNQQDDKDKEPRYRTESPQTVPWESNQAAKFRRVTSPEKETIRAPVRESTWTDDRMSKGKGWDNYSRSDMVKEPYYHDHYSNNNDHYNSDPRSSGAGPSKDLRSSSQSTTEVPVNSRSDYRGSDERYQNGISGERSYYDDTNGSQGTSSYGYNSQPNTQSGYYGNRFTDSSSSSGTPSSSTPPLPSQSPSPLLPYGFPQNGSYLPYGMPSQVPTFQTSPPTSNQYLSSSQYSNTVPSSSEQEALKKKFKANSSNIVINRLSKYFNSGQIASKDHFKVLSRKIIYNLLEKEHPRYTVEEERVKKFVDNCFLQYQNMRNNPVQLDQWLQSSDEQGNKV